MEYNRVIEELQHQYGFQLGSWTPNGKICFKINNEFEICMAHSPFERAFFLSSPLHQLNLNTSSEFYKNLLAYNLFGNKTGNGFLSIDLTTDTLMLMEKFDEEVGDFTHFEKKFKQFITTVIDLKKRINDLEFSPITKRIPMERHGKKI